MAQSDYNTAVLALSGIQNYWPCTEANGSATSFADSKASNTATVATAPAAVTGPDGVASFPNIAATANKVLLPGSSVTMPKDNTVGYWMRLNAQTASDMMSFEWATGSFAKYSQHDIGYAGVAGNSAFSAFYGTVAGAAGQRVVRTTFPNSQWVFVCVVTDTTQAAASQVKLYANGLLVTTTDLSSIAQTQTPGSGTLGIGGRGQGGRALPLDGAIGGVFITTNVLTSAQMVQLAGTMLPVTGTVNTATGTEGTSSVLLVAADDFTDTASVSLASHTPTGTGASGVWTIDSSISTASTAIISNANRVRAAALSGGSDVFYTHSAVPASADYTVEVDAVNIDVSGGTVSSATVGALARWTTGAGGSGYQLWVLRGTDGTGTLELWRYGGSGTAQLGTYSIGALGATTTYRVRLVTNGTTVTGYLDGVQRISVTETSITAAGAPGVRVRDAANNVQSNTTGIHADNWRVAAASFTTSTAKSGSDSGTLTETSNINSTVFLVPQPSSTGVTQSGGAQTAISGSGAADGLNYNAFPGLCKAANGNLILAVHHANDHVGDGSNKLNVHVGTPDGSGGYTWGAATTLRTTSAVNIADVSCITLQDGRVLVTWNESTTPGHATVNTVVTYYRAYSPDSGSTWGSNQTSAVPGWATTVAAGSGGGAYAIAPTPPVQLANGDLLVASYGWDNRAIEDGGGSFSSHEYVKCCKSTDSGGTWSIVGTVFPDTAGVAYDETALLVLDNASVLAVSRVITGTGTGYDIKTSLSTDSGGTWSAPVTILGSDATTGYGGRPSVVQTRNGGLLLRFRYMSAGVSSWTGYRYSSDRGVTWSASDVDPYDATTGRTGTVTGTGRGPDIYGALTETSANTVAYAWCEELTSSSCVVYFRTLTVTGGTTELNTDTGVGTEGVSNVNVGVVHLSATDTGAGSETSSINVTSSTVTKSATDSGLLSESSTVSANVTFSALSSSESAVGSEGHILARFGPSSGAIILNTVLQSTLYGSTTLTTAQAGSTTVTTAPSTVIS